MNAKQFVPLFIAVLLTLLAGSTAQAEPPTQGGSYDPQVVARFVGEWQFLSGNANTGNLYNSRKGLRVFIEDRRTYAEIRICTPTGNPCYWFFQASTLGDKLYTHSRVDPYIAPPWWEETVTEFLILGNGHLQEKSDTTMSWNPLGIHAVFEYVRVGELPSAAPTRAPTQPPVPPVQPVVPEVSQAGIPACSEVGYSPSIIPQVLADESQCTKYVYYRAERKDLYDCWERAYPNAKDWDDWARETWPGGHSQKCPNLKVNPPVKGQPPNLQDILPGDVVVWEAWCGGAKENGHVALATASNAQNGTIDFDQANWPEGSGFSHRNGVKVENCMSFIHQAQPSQSQSTTKSLWETIIDWLRRWFK